MDTHTKDCEDQHLAEAACLMTGDRTERTAEPKRVDSPTLSYIYLQGYLPRLLKIMIVFGGGVRESNPPEPFLTPRIGFEDRG